MVSCLRTVIAAAALLVPAAAWADLADALRAIERRDFATAAQELSPLAKSGDPEAQYQLGTLYANGDGVPQSYVTARELFSASAAQGNGRARQALAFLADIGAISAAVATASSTQGAASPGAAVTPVASGGLRLQLGTVLTEAGGAAEARRVARRFESHLAGISVSTEQYQMASGDFVYRVLTPALAEAQARDMCERIRAENGSCLLVNP